MNKKYKTSWAGKPLSALTPSEKDELKACCDFTNMYKKEESMNKIDAPSDFLEPFKQRKSSIIIP